MNKKFEFDLVMSDPGEALSRIIKEAGYTPRMIANSPIDKSCVIITEEIANSEEDVFEFIRKVNEVADINLEIYEIKYEDVTYTDGSTRYRTSDGKFLGIVHVGGTDELGRTPSDEDTRFLLKYSSNVCI